MGSQMPFVFLTDGYWNESRPLDDRYLFSHDKNENIFVYIFKVIFIQRTWNGPHPIVWQLLHDVFQTILK